MKIPSLLNPEPDFHARRRSSQHSRRMFYRESSSEYSPERTLPPQVPKKTKSKDSKDAAKFHKGPTNGEVRYPPYEATDQNLINRHKKFSIFPRGEIALYPRHIPYNSDKKDFLAKTGRDSFEVFQYTFKIPNSDKPDKEWVVMWDYNIGLVRITPFFKSLDYIKKTAPRNAIEKSPGLFDLGHSITGGALAAQGYWLPFPAARALAATFCYEIRHALTPIFGPSFPKLCLEPADPAFKRHCIPAATVALCAAQVRSWTAGGFEERCGGDEWDGGVVIGVADVGGGRPRAQAGQGRRQTKSVRLAGAEAEQIDHESSSMAGITELEVEASETDEAENGNDDEEDATTSASTVSSASPGPPVVGWTAVNGGVGRERPGTETPKPGEVYGEAVASPYLSPAPSLRDGVGRGRKRDVEDVEGKIGGRERKRGGEGVGKGKEKEMAHGYGKGKGKGKGRVAKFRAEEARAALALVQMSRGGW